MASNCYEVGQQSDVGDVRQSFYFKWTNNSSAFSTRRVFPWVCCLCLEIYTMFNLATVPVNECCSEMAGVSSVGEWISLAQLASS